MWITFPIRYNFENWFSEPVAGEFYYGCNHLAGINDFPIENNENINKTNFEYLFNFFFLKRRIYNNDNGFKVYFICG